MMKMESERRINNNWRKEEKNNNRKIKIKVKEKEKKLFFISGPNCWY